MKKNFLLLIVLYYTFIIFSFSAQPANLSSSESKGIVEKIYEILMVFGDRLPEIPIENFIRIVEPLVRKLAHFANFFILAVFMCMYVNCFKKEKFFSFLLVLLVCLFVAACDEFHQLFVDGRAGRGMDVIIDLSGAALGNLIFNLPGALFYKSGEISYEKN